MFDTVSLYDAFGWTRGTWITRYYPAQGSTGDSVGWGGSWGAETIFEPVGGQLGSNPGFGGSGLMLLGYRFYSPDTGRFLTRDPIGYDGGLNLYAYTRNNPVMGADPLGLDTPGQQGWNFLVGEAKGFANSIAASNYSTAKFMFPAMRLIPNSVWDRLSTPFAATNSDQQDGEEFGEALTFFASFFVGGAQNAERIMAEEGSAGLLSRMKAATRRFMGKNHVVDVRVSEGDDVIFQTRIRSGNATEEELTINPRAHHTEARAARNITLQPGQTMTIKSLQNPPCDYCQDELIKMAECQCAGGVYHLRTGWVCTTELIWALRSVT
jgi:hypothetical protein